MNNGTTALVVAGVIFLGAAVFAVSKFSKKPSPYPMRQQTPNNTTVNQGLGMSAPPVPSQTGGTNVHDVEIEAIKQGGKLAQQLAQGLFS